MGIPAWLPRLLRLSTLICCTVCLSGCGVGYLWHVAVGQVSILARQRPVAEGLQGEPLTPQEQQKVRLILDVRNFAINQLGLHAGKSYTTFVHIDRPYVSYNLSAAPPDALTPYAWRFPFVGRTPYKGFFDKDYALC